MTTMTNTRTDDEGGEYDSGLYRDDTPATLLPSSTALDHRMIGEYRDLGFLAMADVISPAQVRDAVHGLAELAARRPEGVDIQLEAFAHERLAQLEADEQLDVVRKLQRFVHADERLRQVAASEQVLGPVRAILGTDDVVLFQDMALLKPPGGGREKPWHQDKAFFALSLETPIVGVWIALDEATPANGCMHVIPGSHLEGPIPHVRRRDWQICDSKVPTARDVVVPLPPGAALFFDGLLHHGTPANVTSTRRRALQFHYLRRDAVRTSDAERLMVFGPEGADAEC
ncbi:phytanoyl-CoA dioxygenase family protein [Pseudactinotalea suaedae]|uniref:phytanoyl-CoA dioxygenase family protein n=1 Tax=Pseudactinotalea suaedae TaxID=1524924 RepID=UPI0012E2033F|nr:phytanoyl-CoA dioxygenase family protein [Pseudactinotalea suaedae]